MVGSLVEFLVTSLGTLFGLLLVLALMSITSIPILAAIALFKYCFGG